MVWEYFGTILGCCFGVKTVDNYRKANLYIDSFNYLCLNSLNMSFGVIAMIACPRLATKLTGLFTISGCSGGASGRFFRSV